MEFILIFLPLSEVTIPYFTETRPTRERVSMIAARTLPFNRSGARTAHPLHAGRLDALTNDV